MSNYDVIFKSR